MIVKEYMRHIKLKDRKKKIKGRRCGFPSKMEVGFHLGR